MSESVEIGRVLGTEPATPLAFWVALAKDRVIQLDEVVALERKLPDAEVVRIYGIVTELRAMHEGEPGSIAQKARIFDLKCPCLAT